MSLFRQQFIRKLEPMQLPFICFTVCRTFLPFLTPWNTYLVFTRSVQMISTLLQNYTWKHSGYFSSTFRGFQFTAPRKAMFQMQILPNSSSNFIPMCLWKILPVLVECCFCHGKYELCFTCMYCTVLFSCHKSSWNILQPSVVFDLSQSALWMVALRFSLS
jgi:hypothetical protein